MPNAIAHFGAQGVLTKAVIRDAPAPWIMVGAVIPDVPWILQRLVLGLGIGLDPYDLRLYATAQASLLVSLLLCAALAALASAPRRIFAVLALGSVLHLVLDGLQTKWGNGVHLLAPFSWEMWNAELFWPEQAPTFWLTALGAGFIVYALVELRRGTGPSLARPSRSHTVVSLVSLLLYAVAPMVLLNGPRAADNHYVETLRSGEDRAGRPIELDRVRFVAGAEGGTLVLTLGDELAARGELPAGDRTISIRGVFVDHSNVRVHRYHDHTGWPRDELSMAGLLLLALLWVTALSSGRGARGTGTHLAAGSNRSWNRQTQDRR